jgi:hypothetical protein
MADYKVMYADLFNTVTDAINIQQKAQVKAEEQFIDHKDLKIIVLENPDKSEG